MIASRSFSPLWMFIASIVLILLTSGCTFRAKCEEVIIERPAKVYTDNLAIETNVARVRARSGTTIQYSSEKEE